MSSPILRPSSFGAKVGLPLSRKECVKFSNWTGIVVDDLAHKFSELIGELNFDIIASKLQAETTIFFLEELADEESGNKTRMTLSEEDALTRLYDAFLPKTDTIAKMLTRLPEIMSDLHKGTVNIERFLMTLRFIYIKGKVEVARINEGGASFANTFEELVKVVEAATKRLNDIATIIQTHRQTVHSFGAYESEIRYLGEDLRKVTSTANQPAA